MRHRTAISKAYDLTDMDAAGAGLHPMVFYRSSVDSMLRCLPCFFAVCSCKSMGAVPRQLGPAVA